MTTTEMNESARQINEDVQRDNGMLARAPGAVPALVRSPLARGRRYQYAGFRSGFRVKYVAFRGHPEDDGGLQGVAIQWTGFPGRKGSMFYPCASDKEFFDMLIFRNAYDRPNNMMSNQSHITEAAP